MQVTRQELKKFLKLRVDLTPDSLSFLNKILSLITPKDPSSQIFLVKDLQKVVSENLKDKMFSKRLHELNAKGYIKKIYNCVYFVPRCISFGADGKIISASQKYQQVKDLTKVKRKLHCLTPNKSSSYSFENDGLVFRCIYSSHIKKDKRGACLPVEVFVFCSDFLKFDFEILKLQEEIEGVLHRVNESFRKAYSSLKKRNKIKLVQESSFKDLHACYNNKLIRRVEKLGYVHYPKINLFFPKNHPKAIKPKTK